MCVSLSKYMYMGLDYDQWTKQPRKAILLIYWIKYLKLKMNKLFRRTREWIQHRLVRFVWMVPLQWFFYLVDICCVVRGV